jgi:hypothetical protein
VVAAGRYKQPTRFRSLQAAKRPYRETKTMKKTFALAAVLALGVVACSPAAEEATTETAADETAVAEDAMAAETPAADAMAAETPAADAAAPAAEAAPAEEAAPAAE